MEEHDGLEILYLPTATPKLSAVESVWKEALVNFGDLCCSLALVHLGDLRMLLFNK